MAIRYYDEALTNKIKKWVPEDKIRVLKPNETERLFAMTADLSGDNPISFPLISIYRDTNIDILNTNKTILSFDGVKVAQNPSKTAQLNVIPIGVNYQIDIFARRFEEADELVRELLFNLINKPKIVIGIPYNGFDLKHVANIKVVTPVSDTSDIPLKLFKDQFTRYTIELVLQDGYLFNIPYSKNWKVNGEYDSSIEMIPSKKRC